MSKVRPDEGPLVLKNLQESNSEERKKSVCSLNDEQNKDSDRIPPMLQWWMQETHKQAPFDGLTHNQMAGNRQASGERSGKPNL